LIGMVLLKWELFGSDNSDCVKKIFKLKNKNHL